jgi:hypothetical protein
LGELLLALFGVSHVCEDAYVWLMFRITGLPHATLTSNSTRPATPVYFLVICPILGAIRLVRVGAQEVQRVRQADHLPVGERQEELGEAEVEHSRVDCSVGRDADGRADADRQTNHHSHRGL